MKDWGFDGIDVDWEYPSDDKDTKNMVLLLEAVRTELDNYAAEHSPGHHFELSIAAPAGPRNIGFLDIPRLNAVLDYFFIMAYDFAGSWSNMSGHQANLFHSESNPDATPFSIQEAVDAYLANGATPSKLILGMPVYGRSFTSTDGPGLPYANVGEGDWEAGVWDYKSLPKPGAVITYDESASATLSYDSGTSVLISFDTPDMVKKKIAYIKDLGLGGSMFWEASADKSGAESLISTAVRNMGELKDGDNLLQYPVSQYDNIKNGLA
jgi:chitinase